MSGYVSCGDCQYQEPVKFCGECGQVTGGRLCFHPISERWSMAYMRAPRNPCSNGKLFLQRTPKEANDCPRQ